MTTPTFGNLPPELLQVVARYYVCSVPQALLFSSLGRRFSEMIDSSIVWHDLARARWPGFCFSMSPVFSRPQFAQLYCAELSEEFSPLSYSARSLASRWNEGDTGRKIILESSVVPNTRTKEFGSTKFLDDSDSDSDPDPDADDVVADAEKIDTDTHTDTEVAKSSTTNSPSSLLSEFGEYCRATSTEQWCEISRLSGKRLCFGWMGYFDESEQFIAIRNSWWCGRFALFVRRERSFQYSTFTYVLVAPWSLPSIVNPEFSHPFVSDEDSEKRTESWSKLEDFDESDRACRTRIHEVFRCSILSRLKPMEKDVGDDGVSLVRFQVGSVISRAIVALQLIRRDREYSFQPTLKDENLPFYADVTKIIHEKLLLWAIDGVLSLPAGKHFLRVVRFLLMFEKNPVRSVRLSRNEDFVTSLLSTGFLCNSDDTFPPVAFHESTQCEVFRRKFYFDVEWDTSGMGDSLHDECGEGMLFVTQEGFGFEIHRRRSAFIRGWPMT